MEAKRRSDAKRIIKSLRSIKEPMLIDHDFPDDSDFEEYVVTNTNCVWSCPRRVLTQAPRVVARRMEGITAVIKGASQEALCTWCSANSRHHSVRRRSNINSAKGE